MSLAKIIYDDRRKRKMSMAEYAKFLNNHTNGTFCAQNINAIEKGNRPFPIKAISGFHKITEISLDVLFWRRGVIPIDIREIEISDDDIDAVIDYARFLSTQKGE